MNKMKNRNNNRVCWQRSLPDNLERNANIFINTQATVNIQLEHVWSRKIPPLAIEKKYDYKRKLKNG